MLVVGTKVVAVKINKDLLLEIHLESLPNRLDVEEGESPALTPWFLAGGAGEMVVPPSRWRPSGEEGVCGGENGVRTWGLYTSNLRCL